TLAAAVANAFSRKVEPRFDSFPARMWLVWITLAGSLARGFERTWGRFDSALAFSRFSGDWKRAALRGVLRVEGNPHPIDRDRFLELLRSSLIGRGFAVRGPDPFALSDLEILAWPFLRVPINAIPEKTEALALRWRLS